MEAARYVRGVKHAKWIRTEGWFVTHHNNNPSNPPSIHQILSIAKCHNNDICDGAIMVAENIGQVK